MRTKTRQRITTEEYEYEEYRLSHEDHEVSEYFYLFDQLMTDKELIKYLDDLVLVNNDDDDYPYTESDVPPNEFTYTKNDIRVDKNGKKYIYTDEDEQIIRGDCDCSQEVVVLDDGQRYHPFYNKFSLEKITKRQ